MAMPGYALITGGGSGIGLATALLLAREGAYGIALADIEEVQLKGAIAEIEAVATNDEFQCIAILVDVRKAESVAEMVKKTADAFGRVDYAVNSAGIGYKKLGVETEALDWERVMAVNLTGVFNSTKEEMRQMLKQEPIQKARYLDAPAQRGAIVNVSSIAGHIGIQQSSAYVASKHGVVGLTRTFALENPQVKINAIAPGYIKTPMTSEPGEMSRNAREKVANWTALQRFGLPEEVAEAILWLLSSRSNFVHGTSLAIDGGYLAH
ncbi:3-oxoacyl-[acyl-carrier-protein] FabG [Cyphellophora attinorum]|uniref:3-oxoacyl-[acyl-carrier-protein] FabG n=1 Tax=Cyphellophora attinorum TaxID=1664694 RepID=A0A0N0NJ92_9EURO|nr:3-oxoacyl-[acyl-carrier-protein] FabG [Phialophora attinorum]KPI36349.1 3-oxoacyl-[acyl-carrier-protein] FabG [Phialophora attinorum]